MHRWIQDATKKSTKGALHRQLGINPEKKISLTLLRKVVKAQRGSRVYVLPARKYVTVTPLLKHRSRFAINVRRRR